MLSPVPAEIALLVQVPRHRLCTLGQRKQLFDALENGDIETVETMIMRSLDPNAQDDDGFSVLQVAARFGKLQMLNLLLEAGAQTDLLDTSCWGQTALHDAAGQGHVECVRSLLPASANPNILNSHGHTPLSQAVGRDVFSVYDFVDAVRTVLRAAASASCKCSGLSPILQAIENQSYKYHVVWHLLEAAEDPNCSSGQHDTAWHIAARENMAVAIECWSCNEKQRRTNSI